MCAFYLHSPYDNDDTLSYNVDDTHSHNDATRDSTSISTWFSMPVRSLALRGQQHLRMLLDQ